MGGDMYGDALGQIFSIGLSIVGLYAYLYR